MATNNKYDRQLRLWGSNGQKLLSETRIILIRATSVGTETLKNLILPGIGYVTIIDDVMIDEDNKQYSYNFFLSKNGSNHNGDGTGTGTGAIGISRAQMAQESLQELNPDVKVSYQHLGGERGGGGGLCDIPNDEEWGNLLLRRGDDDGSNSSSSNNDAATAKNVLVIGSDLEPALLCKVSSICHKLQLSFMQVTCYGLIGLVRLQCPLLPILDPKPESTAPDLRLCRATTSSSSSSTQQLPQLEAVFPQLNDLFDTINQQWDALSKDNFKFGHLPYPFILLKAQHEYVKEGKHSFPPNTYEEKNQFRSFIKNELATNYENQMNFQEAYNNAYLAYTTKSIDHDHMHTLKQKCKDHLDKSSGSSISSSNSIQVLHLLLQCLEEFLQSNHGQLPLHGTIPDMTASTDMYVQLQMTYANKAKQDVQQMKSIVSSINNTNSNNIDVSEEQLSSFCQNVALIDMIDTGHTIEQEYHADTATTAKGNNDNNEYLASLVDDLIMVTYDPYEVPEHTPLIWYFGLRACFMFYQEHSRYPGTATTEYESDIPLLETYIYKVIQLSFGDTALIESDFVKEHLHPNGEGGNCHKIATELTRYGNAEIHNIASYIGGVASQEAVKIITGQYVPFNNTYIYNGIVSVGATYKL